MKWVVVLDCDESLMTEWIHGSIGVIAHSFTPAHTCAYKYAYTPYEANTLEA